MKENRFDKKGLNSILAKLPVVLGFFASLVIMNRFEHTFKNYSNGAGTIDMRFGYGSADIYQLFETLGVNGRNVYIKIWCIDVIFILCFALLQVYLMQWIMGRELLNSRWRHAVFLAYLRGLFDITEDVLLFIMLLDFPHKLMWLGIAANAATLAKFVFLGGWLAALPVLYSSRKRHWPERS